MPALSVVAGKDQCVENRLGPTGLSSFVVVSLVAVVRPDILPKQHALSDILDQFAFINRRTLFSEWDPEGRSGESVGQSCMARNTEGAVITGGPCPFRPPARPVVKVSGGGFWIPGVGHVRRG